MTTAMVLWVILLPVTLRLPATNHHTGSVTSMCRHQPFDLIGPTLPAIRRGVFREKVL